jgi:hypothetical protein
MIVCPQCKGYGKIRNNNLALNDPGGVTFTDPKQNLELPCNFCGANGYFTGAGS